LAAQSREYCQITWCLGFPAVFAVLLQWSFLLQAPAALRKTDLDTGLIRFISADVSADGIKRREIKTSEWNWK